MFDPVTLLVGVAFGALLMYCFMRGVKVRR